MSSGLPTEVPKAHSGRLQLGTCILAYDNILTGFSIFSRKIVHIPYKEINFHIETKWLNVNHC